MQPEHIFLIIWIVAAICMVSMFLFNGREALKKFPKLKKSEFEYIEKWGRLKKIVLISCRQEELSRLLNDKLTKDFRNMEKKLNK